MPGEKSQSSPVSGAAIADPARGGTLASEDTGVPRDSLENADSAEQPDEVAMAIQAAPLNDVLAGHAAQQKPEEGIPQGDAKAPDSYADLWDRIRAGFQLPQVDDPLIAVHERWFADNPNFLARTTARARLYLYYIVKEVEKRNMPLEIALLPAIESAYQPRAYSRAKAMGLWQLIAPTARRYGVKIGWWYDGRRDVLSSTRAALDYLQELHDEFNGNWFLALAAYNAGEAEIQRQINYNLRHGKPADYQHLRLKAETRNYVPNLIAFARIVSDPAAHGVELTAIPNEPYFAVVNAGSQIDLNVVARLADTPVDVLSGINPGLNRWATPPDGPHHILVPVDNEVQLIEGLSRLPREARIQWRHYHVRRGDTLGRIAHRYGVTVSVVQRANKLRGTLIHTGVDLIIPTSSGPIDAQRTRARKHRVADRRHPAGQTTVKHHVRKGESLWSIAHDYGVSVSVVQRANKIRGTRIRPGIDLIIPTSSTPIEARRGRSATLRVADRRHPAGQTTVKHHVRKGESLWSIAHDYGVQVSQIAKWNTIGTAETLHINQTLRIWTSSGVD